MRNSILSDIRTAARLFKQVRQAGKEGVEVRIREQAPLSVIDISPSLIHTVEGCVLMNCGQTIYDAASRAFMGLPCEKRHQLSFAPKDGEFIGRANLWKEILKPAMASDQYGIAIKEILHWYIHIKAVR